ncbi:Uncharacterised protein [Vibrio cholerae]|nr:Uncharacterised protein [Vibrio cholerae]
MACRPELSSLIPTFAPKLSSAGLNCSAEVPCSSSISPKRFSTCG